MIPQKGMLFPQKKRLKDQLKELLAHGLNQIYPKEHSIYLNQIANQGALLSEFWSTASFEKSNFLKRNRIIAGIAHATLVIESGIK